MAAVTLPAFDSVYGAKEAALCNHALSRLGCELILDTTESTAQARACRSVYQISRDDLLRLFPFRFSTRSASIPEDAGYDLPFSEYTHAYKGESWDTFTGNVNATTVISSLVGLAVGPSLLGMEVSGNYIENGSRIIGYDGTAGAETITIDRAATATAVGATFSIHIPVMKLLYTGGDRAKPFQLVGSGDRMRVLSNLVSSVDDDGTNRLEIQYIHKVVDPDGFDPLFRDALIAMVASRVAFTLLKDTKAKQVADAEFASILAAAKVAANEELQIDEADLRWSDYHAIGSDVYPGRTG